MSFATDERTDLLDLLRGLTVAQWEAQSLCTAWRVRDVAVHVVSYDELSNRDLAATFLRGGPRVSMVNQVAMRRYADLDAQAIIDLVARCLRPRGLTAGFKGGIALTDSTIHQQDIRRAIGLPRTIPPERLARVLDFAMTAPTLPAKKNARGLRLIATDMDWTTGSGPVASGPAEALLMTIAGRPDALADLDGDGTETLRQRIHTR
ncbi:MAG: maleylpyruvate isomerase family mycothiol-dependent enzyme [Aeromicrobium sp.]